LRQRRVQVWPGRFGAPAKRIVACSHELPPPPPELLELQLELLSEPLLLESWLHEPLPLELPLEPLCFDLAMAFSYRRDEYWAFW
jgi:hypothetical protein